MDSLINKFIVALLNTIMFVALIVVAGGCDPTYPPKVQQALNEAGANREQLVKVLAHYSKNPADSLKLRAAEFLIGNMPGQYT